MSTVGRPRAFTAEQQAAIDRRHGRLLLDAGAGSGKTSVLVERFARAVEEDGVDPASILAITFTEKAANEMRERVRRRLGLGEDPPWILTIHGFCARVLGGHALAAGLDPQFRVLDEDGAAALAETAFAEALARAAETTAGSELLATYRISDLRGAVLSAYRALRSQGERAPRLPGLSAVATATADGAAGLDGAGLAVLAAAVAAELGALEDPGVSVLRALELLERLDCHSEWPGDLPDLPANAKALRSEACERFRDGVAELRRTLADRLAVRMRDGLDALLADYAGGYEQAKRARGAVDFDDLELLARDVLSATAPGSYRFAHVMVDELQDTNAVQLAIVDLIAAAGPEAAAPSLFMVGDAQQSIYGFRHADVNLFRSRGRDLEAQGGRLALRTNFRTRAEILDVLNVAFATLLEDFMALAPGRDDPPATDPRVELIIADKTAEWADDEGLATPWRAAEARALAARVATLVNRGECRPGDVVVLTRATTDLRVYERALEAAGVPTFVVGGRGYWDHPQVVEFVAYLRALANPLDQEAYWTVLLSPLCGLSLDGLVLVSSGAAESLELEDAGRLSRFEAFFATQRRAARWQGPEALIDTALAWSGYELALARMPDGRRRLANLRKLMRLGAEWQAEQGPDLRGFLDRLERRSGAGARDGEAPVESEALDAVRLMTIHRSKGLEFPVVCVADLGRGPAHDRGLLRLGGPADGVPGQRRLGLRVSQPGIGARVEALAFRELREEALIADRAEQRRLFYVAMTRAQERLILSGAARSDAVPRADSLTPIDWIAPALRELDGVAVQDLRDPDAPGEPAAGSRSPVPAAPVAGVAPAQVLAPEAPRLAPSTPVSTLSYSGLALYERCGLRFYTERVLGRPALGAPASGARARGVEIHARLAAGDFSAYDWNETFARIRAARELRREASFAFALDGLLITGVFDVIGEEAERTLVVDYKSDRLGTRDPEAVVADEYAAQRLIYALAALRGGARQVEVVHLFLEAPEHPAAAVYAAGDRPALEAALSARITALRDGDFSITETPGASVCTGCPAGGSLCPLPAAVRTRPGPGRPVPARRSEPDRSEPSHSEPDPPERPPARRS